MKVIEISQEKLESIYIAQILNDSNMNKIIDGGYEVYENEKLLVYIDYNKCNLPVKYIIDCFNSQERVMEQNIVIYISGLTDIGRNICRLMLNKEDSKRFIEEINLDEDHRS